MPWKNVLQRINAKLSSMPESERQRYERVRDDIMKESAYADNTPRETKGLHNIRIDEASSNRMKQLTVLHDVLSVSGQDRYEHVRRNIMQSTAIADQGEIRGGFKSASHNQQVLKARADRSLSLKVLDLLEKYAPQNESVKPHMAILNRPTEKVINVKTATVEDLASMINNMRKNMKKHLKTTADVGHANRDFFAGILRRKDAE